MCMIFLETKVFTNRIVGAMSDDAYAELQGHLSLHPDAGVLIPARVVCGRFVGRDPDVESAAVQD